MIYTPQRQFRLYSCNIAEKPPLLLPISDASAVLLMASWLVLHNLFILFVCIVSSSVVPFLEQGTIVAENIVKKRTPSTTPIKVNTSLTPTENASHSTQLNLTAPRVECDSSRYGQRLKVASCQEAWELLPTGSARLLVGPRGKGNFDIPLPSRVISSECDRTGSSAIRLAHLFAHVC